MESKTGLYVADTACGPIEYFDPQAKDTDTKNVIVTVHVAMGGYDQSAILGKTIGPPGYRYIAISRPGYLGTPLHGNHSPEAQADLLAALLDHLGIEKVIIFAVSGGGYSSITFAVRHPQRCKALVLCSTTGGKNTTSIPFTFTLMRIMLRLPFVPGLLRKRAGDNVENSLKRSISYPDLYAKTVQNEKVMQLYEELSVSCLDRASQRIAGTVNDIRITQHTEYPLQDVMAPTLVIHGSHDPVVPFDEHGRRLAGEIPGATLCLAERGEHVTLFSHNEQVVKAVSCFLGELRNPEML